MKNNQQNLIDLDDNLLNQSESEYTAVIIGRDLPCYLIALILRQHGYNVALASRPNIAVMTDLYEYLSMKYMYEAARRLRSIRTLSSKGLHVDSDFNWNKLTHQCEIEFLEIKQKIEKDMREKGVITYEGMIVMVEDDIIRVINEEDFTQIAVLRTKYVIMGSDICRHTVGDYSKHDYEDKTTLMTLVDLIHLDDLPNNLTVIGGGTLGLSVASCMKELGCNRVAVMERRSHCFMNDNIDKEIAAYIEARLVKQQIEVITKYSVHSYQMQLTTLFIAIGTTRKSNSMHSVPTKDIINLIERVSFGRRIQLGTIVDDGKGGTIVVPMTPIIPVDYREVKSMCSLEQGVGIAYRTICKSFKNPKPNFLMPSLVYTMPSLLLIGQTSIPADNMFICRVTIPPTMKCVTDSPSRGFGKLWISRTYKSLCGVQLVSEHSHMFGKAFGILIRNEICLFDICSRIELSGSIGEVVQLMIKQALLSIDKGSCSSSNDGVRSLSYDVSLR